MKEAARTTVSGQGAEGMKAEVEVTIEMNQIICDGQVRHLTLTPSLSHSVTHSLTHVLHQSLIRTNRNHSSGGWQSEQSFL